MRIRADEHVAPSIVRIVNELVLSHDFELTSILDVGDKGKKDEYWATAFANDGGHAILSADTDFFRRPHQVVAIDDTGLRVIYLPPKWANAPGHMQAAHLLMWWPRVEHTLTVSKKREVWALKWNIREEGTLVRKKVDYGAFRKKLKKADRRSK